jgi:hypothetical protein
MSTILKALRRLELEKGAQEGRPLKDEVTATPDTGSRRGFPLLALMIAAAALGLGLGSSLLWFWPRESAAPELAEAARPASPAPSQPVAASPVAPVAQPAPVPAPAPVAAPQIPAPAPVASAPPLPAEAYASPVEVISRPEPAPAAEPSPESLEPAEQQPPRRGSQPPFAKRRAARAAEPPPPVPAVRAEPIERAEPVEPPAARVAVEEVAPPEAPVLLVSSTVWHPQRDRRLAMVSLEGGPARELHEGDAIGSLIVSEIGPSSVLFLNDGAPLRRRVGARN